MATKCRPDAVQEFMEQKNLENHVELQLKKDSETRIPLPPIVRDILREYAIREGLRESVAARRLLLRALSEEMDMRRVYGSQ